MLRILFVDDEPFILQGLSVLIDWEKEGFEIAGDDKKFYPAKAQIVDRTPTVKVWSEQVSQPVAVRYAFRNYADNITLRNTFGLAAFPFRTDTWDNVK